MRVRLEFVIPHSMAPDKVFTLSFEATDYFQAQRIAGYMLPHATIINTFQEPSECGNSSKMSGDSSGGETQIPPAVSLSPCRATSPTETKSK
jgi:hypothetical protein